ncbi:MAG: copper transporter [Actinomycetota bacterium]
MITFRYHVVTLVAVFMAIGLGVLFGATFIDQNIVEGLEAAQARLGARNEDLRNRIVDLQRNNDALTVFADSTRTFSVKGSLAGRDVLLLSFDSTPPELLEGTTGTLAAAGARIAGTVTLSDQLALGDEAVRRTLGEALDVESLQAQTLAQELVARLVAESRGEQGVLQRLIDAGLAQGQVSSVQAGSEPSPAETKTPPETPAPDQSPAAPAAPGVVILAGTTSRPITQQLVMPLARALAEAMVPAVVAESGEGLRIVTELRQQEVATVTVDGAETSVGQTALAHGLRVAFAGQPGRFGSAEGATTAIPAG